MLTVIIFSNNNAFSRSRSFIERWWWVVDEFGVDETDADDAKTVFYCENIWGLMQKTVFYCENVGSRIMYSDNVIIP